MKKMFTNMEDLMSWQGNRDSSAVLPNVQQDKPRAFSKRTSLHEKTSEALRKTQRYYISQQHEHGYWWYELESNVTIVSEYLMLLHFLGLKDEKRDRKIINHIIRNQSPDGTWSLYQGGKGDISTTVEAYFALKLAGMSSDDEPLSKAREFILREGGLEEARVFTKVYLALFGQFDWKAIPSLPVEINLLPSWFPLNIYSCSSWARSTVVPLSMVVTFKPVRTVPEGAGIRELYKNPDRLPPITPQKLSRLSWKKMFFMLDRIIKAFESMPIKPFRQTALDRTEQWILEHQEATGDWGGIQPAMINSVLALATMGYAATSEPIQKGLEALERFTIVNDNELALQSCISPVWDTALSGLAMLYSGIERDHRSLAKSCTWLASKQIFRKGDWSVKRPYLEPGGWAFEFDNSWYPDVDDSAIVLLFLYKFADTKFIKPENLEKGLRWVLGMQGKDGGWGAFDVDNNLWLLNQLPFGDLEAMIDPSTADLTGRVLELLGSIGYGLSDDRVKRAVEFLKKDQKENGSWRGRWGVNYLYGTNNVLSGLKSIGEDMSSPYIRKAVTWMKSIQNPDGGWGESCESYKKCAGEECIESTPSQTAWVILALIAAGEVSSREVMKGVDYLLKYQKADGTWDEEAFTGTGFPKYFFLRYDNYRNCFPMMALGKFLSQFLDMGISQ